MTKRDFIALAEQLALVRSHFAQESAWRNHCRAIANICQGHNAAFDRVKFLVVCGLDNPERRE